MRRTIGTQVIVAVSLATVVTTGVTAAVIVRTHRAELTAELARSADLLSETIKSSTHYDMLENRRESLHRQIETIGRQQGIEAVRVFNREGRIVFSSVPSEIGRSVDKRAEACYACHAEGRALEKLPSAARSRIFTAADGHRVLGTINPIHNEPGCATAACHAHAAGDTVLGVLDVSVSLAEVDRNIARSQRRMAGLTAAVIAGSGLILWWLNGRLVLRPVRALVAATRRIAEGDLAVVVPVTAEHELGDLARSFNEMTRRLGEAQRQLTQADKLASVGRLAAGVAHEINNPLTGVLTYASLRLKQAEDPGLREDLAVIVRETKRCREIVRNLLDFARHTPPRRQPIELNEVVRRAVTIMTNQLSLNGLSLSLDLAPALPPVLADAGQIQQVVVNLLVNAADAVGDRGGEIRLATRASAAGPQSVVEIVVEDTGAGISAADLPHIFEPFFTTKGSRGSGLGLAVTWGIVEGHQGTVEIETHEGKGSRFTVRLPLRLAAERPPAGEPAASAA